MQASPTIIASGEWENDPQLTGYRAEWLSDTLVERATWLPHASLRQIQHQVVGAPGYVWFRFWLANGEQLLEKYFDEQGRVIGMYARIALARHSRGRGLSAVDLLLGLWITEDARVTVLNEVEFEKAVEEGIIAPVEAEHAEQQIRELTTAITHKRYPPALVRNLTLVDSAREATPQPAGQSGSIQNTKR